MPQPGGQGRLAQRLCANLDEVLTGLYLVLLVGLGIWRGAPIFEDIRSSGLALRTLQFVCAALLVCVILFRGRMFGLLRD